MMRASRRISPSSSTCSCRSGAGTCRGTATRSPVRRSPRGVQPDTVRKGWFSVARTVLPEARSGGTPDAPRREHLRHRSCHIAQRLVEPPHRHLVIGPTGKVVDQVRDRHLGTRVRHAAAESPPSGNRTHAGRSSAASCPPAARAHGSVCEIAMIGTREALSPVCLSARENLTPPAARLDALARRHRLQVVDDDDLEVVPLLEPPALRPDLHQRHVGRIVNEQRRPRPCPSLRRAASSPPRAWCPCACAEPGCRPRPRADAW